MELRAEDLRSNNYVYLTKDDFETVKVYQLDAYDIYKLSESECADVKPILLNEEWLLKLGFDKLEDNLYSLGEYIFVKAEDNDWDDICLDVHIKNVELHRMVYLTCFTHVHELQNFIKSLTGKELTIDN